MTITCVGRDDLSLAKEHIRGTEGIPPDGDGYVSADETFCKHNSNWTGSIKSGGDHYEWAIFHNVPPGGEVALEWGPYPFSPLWVNPWHSPFNASPPAECPPELVTLGTCVSTEKWDTGPGTNIAAPWAGYAVVGKEGNPINFKKVEASWTVPKLDCPLNKTSKVSYWVGLGDVNADLEQIGTWSQCTVAGFPLHFGIWQMIVDKAQGAQFIIDLRYPISSNDNMEASVEYLGEGKYQLTLHNITRGWKRSESKARSTKEVARQTADCIVEWPPGSAIPAPFSNFGVFTFKGCKADNRSLLTYPRLYQFTMKNGSALMAVPSWINSNSDFTVTWKHE